MSRITHVLDTAISLGAIVASTVTPILLADATANSAEDLQELKLLLLPFLGSVIASAGMIMLNPQPETRKIVIGRAMFALFVGAIGPQLLGMIHPSIGQLVIRPAVLLGLGALLSSVAYAASRPWCSKLYERAGSIAEAALNQTERAAGISITVNNQPSTTTPSDKTES